MRNVHTPAPRRNRSRRGWMSPPTPPDAAAQAPRGESRPHHLPLWQKLLCAASGWLVGIAVTYLGWWTGRW